MKIIEGVDYSNRITSDNIKTLNPDEIFVFGSNLSGIHGAGAAYWAKKNFGAIQGKGIGIQGQSYAIPTKDRRISRTLTLLEIGYYINIFIDFAENNSQYKFLVTEIGCGLAGHEPSDIAKLFKRAIFIKNIHLPIRFWVNLKTKS